MINKKSLAIGVSLLSLTTNPYAMDWTDNKENLRPWGQDSYLPLVKKNQFTSSFSPSTDWKDTLIGQDSFTWQNNKHYEHLTELLENLANRELSSIITKLIDLINKNAPFFSKIDAALIDHLKDTVFDWLMDEVLTYSNFIENQPSVVRDADSEMDIENGEDGWRCAYMDGFNYDDSDHDEDDSGYYESEEEHYYEEPEEEREEDEDEAFHEWQKQTLSEMLYIDVMDIEDFTRDSIDRQAIKRFLEEHCEDGYSWLINEIIERSFETSADFVDKISSQIDVPPELLSNIFGGLWFDYDWEEFNFDDPTFIAQTYSQTLGYLLEEEGAEDVKSDLLKSLYQLFTFNGNDFEVPFDTIRSRYNTMLPTMIGLRP